MACSVLSDPYLLRHLFEPSERNMGKYFMQNHELPEPDAANRWFAYAESHGIDIPKAISIWEDAATEEGAEARRLVGSAGITVEAP
jgi:hypothetical protein